MTDSVDGRKDWPQFMGGADGTGDATGRRSVEAGAEHWRCRLGGAETHSSAVLADETVYVGGGEGVVALDPETGTRRWSSDTASAGGSAPAVADGTVYVAGRDGVCYALDADTGAERWRFEAERMEGSPTVSDGTVYVGSDDFHLYALDADTGAERWRFATDDRVRSTPTVADGVVYVGSNDTRCYAVDAATGAERWRYEADDMWMIRARPTVADGTVYVGCRAGSVHAVDAESGERVWQFAPDERDAVSTAAVVDDVVYLGSLTGTVYALDADLGAELWSTRLERPVLSAPTVTDEAVYVGSEAAAIHALDVRTGEERWRFRGGATGDSTATTGGANELVGEVDLVNLFTLETFQVQEVERTGVVGGSTPVVADGTAYVAGQDGAVYAVRPADEAASTAAVDTTGSVATGEWPQPSGGPTRTSDAGTGTPTAPTDLRWTVDVGSGNGFTTTTVGVVDGTLYVGSKDEVGAYDLDTGDSLWTADGAGTDLVVADGRVHYGTTDGETLVAVDCDTGATDWTVDRYWGVGTPVRGVETDRLFVPVERRLVALGPDTGEEVWSAAHDPDYPPVVAHGSVYVVDADAVTAFGTDLGTERWSTTLPARVVTASALADGRLYLPGADGALYVLDAATGDHEGSADVGGEFEAPPAVADGTAYLARGTAGLSAVDAAGGTVEWTFDPDDRTPMFVAPSVAEGVVYVGTDEADLFAVDAATGDRVWNVDLGVTPGAPPVALDGAVAVATTDDRVAVVAPPAERSDGEREGGETDATAGPEGATPPEDGTAVDPESATASTTETPDDGSSASADEGAPRRPDPGEWCRRAATVDDEADRHRTAVLGALCDAWYRSERDARLSTDALVADVTAVVDATDRDVQHAVRRLDDDGFILFQPAHDTVTLRADGVWRYDRLADADLVPPDRLRAVLEPLYERDRGSPDAPAVSLTTLTDATGLDEAELQRTLWYLADLRRSPDGGPYRDGHEGFVEIDARSTRPWVAAAWINGNGRALYERLE